MQQTYVVHATTPGMEGIYFLIHNCSKFQFSMAILFSSLICDVLYSRRKTTRFDAIFSFFAILYHTNYYQVGTVVLLFKIILN
jgi:hypothetical protein